MKINEIIIEGLEEDVAWQSSLSKKIFTPADWTNNYELVWGLWLPLSPSMISKISPNNRRATIFHVTRLGNIENMIKGQSKKRSISGFFNMWHELYQSGIASGGGLVFELDANILGAFDNDIHSTPDNSGMRWIAFEKLAFAVRDSFEPLLEGMYNLIIQLLKKYSPDMKYKNKDEAVGRWVELGQRLNANNEKQTLYNVIKDYIDGTYLIYQQNPKIIMTALRSHLQDLNTEEDWDESVINDYKIKQIHLLKNIIDNPENKKAIEDIKNTNIPVKVWNTSKELYDYTRQVTKSQKNIRETTAGAIATSMGGGNGFLNGGPGTLTRAGTIPKKKKTNKKNDKYSKHPGE